MWRGVGWIWVGGRGRGDIGGGGDRKLGTLGVYIRGFRLICLDDGVTLWFIVRFRSCEMLALIPRV